jgi:superoxide dismutase, Cu-Zn family
VRTLCLILVVMPMLIGCGTEEAIQNQSPAFDAPEQQDINVVQPAVATDAYARLISIGNSGVVGEVFFSSKAGKVVVTGKVIGLTPGEHGFHIHEKGDLSDTEKGESAGGHFNPDNVDHGRPEDSTRHAGDFGNIVANEKGVAEINFEDSVIQLAGINSIIGRSLVVHADADKFTQPSGDSGARVAFGVIEAGKR